ncbi:MAG: septal ring lytic transglycosylase RlpA family protein [Aestuariivirga sp.]|uniref:septal ring lytic transglycosylase RlpA family protein n=1 Tax=Aestuariivirga sp. TaxID=2650926 RepID=UPI0038D136AA
MNQAFFALAASAAIAVTALPAAAAEVQTGKASYYRHGKYTANGERFNPRDYTAAHRTLPFGTKVLVTHVRTGKSVIVRINDRGPFTRGRIIDLSLAAAQALNMTASGVATVKIVPLRKAEKPSGEVVQLR